VYVLTILPSFKDQMCMDLSRDPLTKYSPFGLNATEYTGSLEFQFKALVSFKSISAVNVTV